ncbi:hypothetical protein QWZ16_15975 [Vibrio ostreicida]|nr:hypothetical protein [Vibrio ostreicida]MDN3611140.1 hypothetical protein [Vibrio ostreicida]
MTLGLYLMGIAYYGLYSRHKLVASNAAEELAMLSETDLGLSGNDQALSDPNKPLEPKPLNPS